MKIKMSDIVILCFTLFTIYVHINLLKAYNINKIPIIVSLEGNDSNYYTLVSEVKTYNDIFIVKGSQYFIDINDNTYNYENLKEFRNTYLMCDSDEKCISKFHKQKIVEDILNSWKNYYEDFKPNK